MTDFTGGISEEQGLGEKPSEAKARAGVLSMYVGLVGYFILVFPLDFLIANWVYLMVFVKLEAEVGWLRAIVISAIV